MLRLSCFIVFSLIGTLVCRSKEYIDTLWTRDRDCIILTYAIHQNEKQVHIKFLEARKKLGRLNSSKYKKPENIDVVFFDWIGVYRDAKFKKMVPKSFMVPPGLKYSKSQYGYFFLHESTSISFQKSGKGIDKLTIPIYLSYYKGNSEYELFSVCRDFEISLKETGTIPQGNNKKFVTEAITSTIEIEEDYEETTKVLMKIDAVEALLETQTRLPFSDGLNYELTMLRQHKDRTDNRELALKIEETLTKSEIKKNELEEKANKEAEQAKITAQRIAEEQERIAIAKQDSIRIVQEKKAEAEKERNLWLIIGGIILAGVCFIGNQFLQHIRNVRTQRNMMEMQQHIANQAEREAKRHVRNYTRKKTYDITNKIKQSGKDIIHNKVKLSGDKQKPRNLSI